MISYKGTRFMESAEVRWAVFLDALRIEYVYQHSSFLLPHLDAYLRTCCHGSDKAARRAAKEACQETGKNVYLFSAGPWFNDAVEFFVCTDPEAPEKIGTLEGYGWCQCPVCGRLVIAGQLNPFNRHWDCPELEEYARRCDFPLEVLAPAVDIDWSVISPSLAIAFCAAKSEMTDARFPGIFESLRNAIDLLTEARVFASTPVEAYWGTAVNRAARARALQRAKVVRMHAANFTEKTEN